MIVLPLLVALAAADPPSGQVVEAVVAVVRDPAGGAPEVITRTRVEAESRIALVIRGAAAAAFQPLDEGALRAGLAWLLDETAVAAEAARLRLGDVEPAALAAEVRRFRATLGGPAEYARFLAAAELSDADVAAVLARSLRARRYLESRVGRAAPVREDEIDAYLAEHGLGARTGVARAAVRERLEADRARAAATALVAELRARADVRILEPALRPPPAEQAP